MARGLADIKTRCQQSSFLASHSWARVSNYSVLRRLVKQTIAVVVGNLLYFFLLMPHLPAAGRHRPDRLDLGLIVDFWVCVVLYGAIELADRKWSRKSLPGP